MISTALKARALAGFSRRRALARALAAGRLVWPVLDPPGVEYRIPGFTPALRPQPLVSRRELDEFAGAQRAERYAAQLRQEVLAREVGGMCAMGHCRMAVWGGVSTGWGPAWCIVHAPDEVALRRAMAGDLSVTLWPHERVEAVRRLARRGLSDRETGALLGISGRTVLRIRQQHGIPGIPCTYTPSREDLAS